MMWAIYDHHQGWLVDTCAGGTWDFDIDRATWFGGYQLAYDSLRAADIELAGSMVVVRVK